jgi:hypothetical protein
MTTTADDLAAAVSVPVLGLDGGEVVIDGQRSQPGTFAAWQSWPTWQSAEWMSRCVIVTTWQVLLVLPAGDPAAWGDASQSVLNPVRDGLETVGHVIRAEPVTLASGQLESQTIPALQFTVLVNN